MQPFEKILVPIDFSRGSFQAARRAVMLAPPLGRVDLLHVARIPVAVLTPPSDLPLDDSSTMIDLQETTSALEAELHGVRNTLRRLNPEVHVTTQVIYGDPAAVIISESKDYDLVVVGASHHRGRLSRFFLGSVAAKAVEEAKCPVLVERELVNE